ncbi:DUF3857 domain-containing protein [Bacteroides sedimenti]|uniref:DUF3857 domain-containing protein n=1 Tax=Bacteroides sedimenti TaxID=2136147 RepID=A0ABN6ZBV1_9BACE
MLNKRIKSLLFSLLILSTGFAQDKLALPEIPDSLKENANSIVVSYIRDINYLSDVSAEEKNSSIITILNSKGESEAGFGCSTDMFSELKDFRGVIYDATGKQIRKIKKSELRFSEYTESLADDSRHYYFEPDIANYPVTIKYEWEIKHKNGLIGLPPFFPQGSFNQSVIKAEYRLHAPDKVEFLFKAVNMNEKPEAVNEKGNSYQRWGVANIKAIENEPYTKPATELIPKLYLGPRNFTFDKTKGEMSNWKTYGMWLFGLLKDRDILSDANKKKIAELTKDCKTDYDKVKILYDYLAKTTRYVSIQLGIGGQQPMPAEEVAKTGFGDCKALSNYMRAMLKEVGIPSTYTVISTENKRLLKDYASANQMNHVILQVPLPERTLWLECTNPDYPLGYVHEDIAGHDALLVKETGGEIVTLPTYKDSLNTENHNVLITITEQGNATAKVTRVSKLLQYENMFIFSKLSPTKQIDFLRERVQLPQARVNNISFKEEKTANPLFTVNYNVDCEKYGSKTGNRLFVPINVFRGGLPRLTVKKRVSPILVNSGFLDSDTITLEIPKNYVIESLPKLPVMEKKFGKFSSIISPMGDKIVIINQLSLLSGEYDAEQYPEFAAFCKEVSNAYASKIILKKKEQTL